MPISTDLSVSPYNDDYSASKNFHRMLFKPATPVQVRELNQLQSILQDQIERFGNNVYKRGTIIDGINFQYFPDYAYVKISDNQIDGTPAFPALYVGHFAKDASTNLVAQVINSADGFESTDPNLKTIYLKYINSGNTGNLSSFSSNSVLTVYDYGNSLQSITIVNGSSGFSNSDIVAIVPALAVNTTSSNTFANGEYLIQSGARAIITGVDTTTYPGKTILKIKPSVVDLANTSLTSNAWSFPVGSTVTGNTTSASATITEVIGSGAVASLSADSATGKLTTITVTDRGGGYYVNPYATVQSSGKTVPNYTDLDIRSHNYIGQLTVANTADAIGTGYAFGITSGIVYQKGFFINVSPQIVVVSKYDPLPDGLAIGFVTQEQIIDSNIDVSLLDNDVGPALGRPGADRLKLTPSLTVVAANSVVGNTDFLALVEFSAGQPFSQTYDTQFNAVETEMANRMSDTSGNFVIDRFNVTTRSSYNQSTESSTFSIVTDPGKAYVNGTKVSTQSNFVLSDDKGLDFMTTNNVSTSIDYGNYIEVQEMGGSFQFTTGDVVNFYDTAKTFQSNSVAVNAANTSPPGNLIGTARLRSLIYDQGLIGTPQATYRLYIFDTIMVAGKNFNDVRSVYYNGNKKGIADLVLGPINSAANSANGANIIAGQNRLVFPVTTGVKNITGIQYTYRTMRDSLSMPNTGVMTISLTANTGEFFGYNSPVYGQLTSAQLKDLYLVPTSNNLLVSPNGNGTISINSTSNVVTGTGTAFASLFGVGDHIFAYSNATSQAIARVVSVANNTSLTIDTNGTFTNTSAIYTKVYPQNIPVSLDRIPTANASVDGTGDVLTINIGSVINATSSTVVTAGFDVLRSNVTPQSKVANRNLVAKIAVANNSGGQVGPWCIGVPDVFRLDKVYLAETSTVNTTSQDVTSEFYIDHNQTANYLDLGYLYQKPKSSLQLDTGAYLLVVFDAYVSSPGVYTLTSYVSANLANRLTTDSLALGSLGSNVNSFEVPEVYTYDGTYYDLLDCIDFRPVAANTIALTTTVGSATVNPPSTLSFGNTSDPTNDKKFPLPQTSVLYNVDKFMGRNDLVILTQDSNISILKGVPSANNIQNIRSAPIDSLKLNSLIIPPYPNLPKTLSANTSAIVHTNIANERFSYTRIINRTINTGFSASDIIINQPTNYTMADIGKLERRISDLESQVSLTALETAAKDLSLPSSIDPSIDRFKYGFYADNFANGQFSDVTNPEFHVEFLNGEVVPPSSVTLICHGDDTFVTGPLANEYVLVSQPDATISSSSAPLVASSGTMLQTLVRQQADETILGGDILTGNHYPDSINVTMSTSLNGVQSCTLYLYNYSSGDRISIYKNGSLLTSTLDAVALTQPDVDYLKGQEFFNSVAANLKPYLQKSASSFTYQHGWDVLYGAKIVFQHNPSDGNVYNIVTEKGPQSNTWRWQLNYYVNAESVSPSNVPMPISGAGNTTPAVTNTAPFTSPSVDSPVVAGPQLYEGVATVDGVLQRSAAVTVSIRGLMPNTNHVLYVNQGALQNQYLNANLTGYCSVPLTSDAQGMLVFQVDPALLTSAWGKPASIDSTYFDNLSAISFSSLNSIPLILTSSNYVFGAPLGPSFALFSIGWLSDAPPPVAPVMVPALAPPVVTAGSGSIDPNSFGSSVGGSGGGGTVLNEIDLGGFGGFSAIGLDSGMLQDV